MSRIVAGVAARVAQMLSGMMEVHLPMSIWLDSTTLTLYRTSQRPDSTLRA
jgi:hypothetical protein